mgnify:CR=1 FL=1
MGNNDVLLDKILLNDYIYRILAKVDVSFPDTEDLKEARKLLLEMSNYIIQANLQSNMPQRPKIAKGRI